MFDQLADQLALMAAAYGIVTAGSVAAWLVLLRLVSPTPKEFHASFWSRFTGPEVLALVVLDFVVLPMVWMEFLRTTQVWKHLGLTSVEHAGRLVMVLKLPSFLAMLVALRWRHLRWPRPLPAIAFGVAGAQVLTLPVLTLHFLAIVILLLGGGTPERHPLSQAGADTPADVALLVLSACVAAPILEEVVFRGLLLHWCRKNVSHSLLVFAMAMVFLLLERGVTFLPAILFLLDAVLLMVLCVNGRKIFKRWPTRSASAILATATLFAVLHASVWPTPWPLLLFGIVLGMMSVRSGRVLPSIVTHSLFNLVSVVYLLSGGT